MQPTQLDQPVALGPKLGPQGLPRALRGHQKGLSGPKRALFGAPGGPLRSRKGPKHMILMCPTQAHGVEVFWVLDNLSWPSQARPIGAQNFCLLAVLGPEKASEALVTKT